MQCAQIHMHLVESDAPSGSSLQTVERIVSKLAQPITSYIGEASTHAIFGQMGEMLRFVSLLY